MDLLAEIRSAFPHTPYPGDQVLSDCWCEECSWAVRNLRGKSWKQIKLDDINGDGDQMTDDAFRYYLPALLSLSVQHPSEYHLASRVTSRLVACDRDPPERAETIQKMVSSLSKLQRTALGRFLDWLDGKYNLDPIIGAAKRTVAELRVYPYSYQEVLQWCSQFEKRHQT